MQSTPTLLGVLEFAKAAGVSPDTVRRSIAAGEISSVRLRRRVLVPASELARLAAGGGQ